MSNKRRLMYCALWMVLLLSCIGIYNHCTRKPVIESVERDTVVVYDTIPHYYPTPKDSVRTKWVTRWLPASPDTIDHFIGANNMVGHFRDITKMMDHYADTSKMIAVEVPITSKHYGCKDYDAWVSGYEPNLDSIKVYQRTEYITERVTISKPPNRWELDLIGGLDYNTARQDFTPYAGGEILYKPNRLQVGVRAVVSKTANTGNVEPFIGGVVKIRIF